MTARPDSAYCAIFHQLHGLTMADLVEQDPALPVYCDRCEERMCVAHGRLDCARCSATAAPQGETVRLFAPAPAVMPGQLGLGVE